VNLYEIISKTRSIRIYIVAESMARAEDAYYANSKSKLNGIFSITLVGDVIICELVKESIRSGK